MLSRKKKWKSQITLRTFNDESEICIPWLPVNMPNKFTLQISIRIENRHKNNRKAHVLIGFLWRLFCFESQAYKWVMFGTRIRIN